MQIDIKSIKCSRENSLEISFLESFEIFNTKLGELEFKDPVALEGKIFNKGDNFLLEATIKTTVYLKCSRCHKSVAYVIDLQVEEIFIADYTGEDEEIWTFTGNIIELDQLVMSNIVLDIPMKVLCSDECKGLCPKCGHDLSESDCGCDMTEIDPRFDKLWSMFKDEEV